MALPKLLITGHNGLIGRILWRGLADAFELYGVDICLSEQAGNVFRADISKPEQVNAIGTNPRACLRRSFGSRSAR
jgi:nucleoside-diphosphate-sugar epimerase